MISRNNPGKNLRASIYRMRENPARTRKTSIATGEDSAIETIDQ